MSRHQEPGGHQGRKGTSHGQDGTSNLDKSKPIDTEETNVATQLVGTVEVEKESGRSPSRTSGAPQEIGVFPTPSRGYERMDPPEQCSMGRSWLPGQHARHDTE